MRHLKRAHRVRIEYLYETCASAAHLVAMYEKSGTMATAMYTKVFSNPAKWSQAAEATDMFSLDEMVKRHFLVLPD